MQREMRSPLKKAVSSPHSTKQRKLSLNFTVRKTPHPLSVSTCKIIWESKTGGKKQSMTKVNTLQRCWNRSPSANPSVFRPNSRTSSRASRGGSGGERMSMNTKSGGAEGRAVCFNRFHKGTVPPFSENRKMHGSHDTNIVRRQVLHRFNPEINRDLLKRALITWHQ